MAIRYFWIGSHGPFPYDDTENYEGEAISMVGIRTEQMIVTEAPTDPSGVIRLADISNLDSASLSKAESANLSQSTVISRLDSESDSSVSRAESINVSQATHLSNLESKVASHGL